MKRCGHDNDTQIRAQGALAIQGHGKPGICGKAAFMEFVEDQESDVREFRVAEEPLG